jgi:glyoxylase-like metal-dependent hydrolase (beta-lactamase superfamily II)
MDTYGLTAEQAGDGSPDVVWLLREKKGEARPYSGERLPFGGDVFLGHKANDTVLWVESQRAVISGDTLVDFGRGLEINERWLRPGVTREQIAERLRPLLELPVEHVLATHGGPTDRAALELPPQDDPGRDANLGHSGEYFERHRLPGRLVRGRETPLAT